MALGYPAYPYIDTSSHTHKSLRTCNSTTKIFFKFKVRSKYLTRKIFFKTPTYLEDFIKLGHIEAISRI